MRVVDHIATTTDCWSVRRRRFIGVTVHWIDPESLTRYSAALAHSWKVRTHSMCWQTPWMISIPSLKFVVRFWEQIMVLISEKLSRFLEKMRRTMQSKVMVMHLKREVEFVDVSALLNEDDGFEFRLPCHLLNLIAMVEAMKATSNEVYKKVYHSTFGKCNALWNKCGRSTLAAKNVEDVCSIQMQPGGTPCSWQWKDCWGSSKIRVRGPSQSSAQM